MALHSLKPGIWAIEGAVNMGLVATEAGLVAVDTGLDASAAKVLRRAAEEIGRPLVGIINTHAHADHFGGNADLLRRFDLTVYAPVGEAAVMRRPAFEPEYLWQGAQPLREMRNKFLQASPTRVDVEFEPDATWSIGGVVFSAIPMFGHAHGQTAIATDGVIFAADSYFDPAVVDKHGIPYFVDYAATQASATGIAQCQAEWWVPGHGVPTEDVRPAVSYYRDRLEQIYHAVIAAATGCGLEDITAAVCARLNVSPNGAGPYALVRTAIAACVTGAVDEGLVSTVVAGGRLLFAKSSN